MMNKPILGNNTNVFSLERSRVPKDTKEINVLHIDNFNLQLNKVIQFVDDRPELFRQEKGKTVVNVLPSEVYLRKIAKKCADNYFNLIKKLANILVCEPLRLSLSWRLIVGLGHPSVYETSMTLHHIYGIPYLPGSAIKGITRSWRLLQLAEEMERGDGTFWENIVLLENFLINAELLNEKKRLPDFGTFKKEFVAKSVRKGKIEPSQKFYNYVVGHRKKLEEFQLIFGTKSYQGCVTFFDSFPSGEFKIEYDVMTPHYSPYYSFKGKEPPADYYNPTPIPFLTVSNATFRFYLGISKRRISNGTNAAYILEKTKTYLKEALIQHGIGAKTALGYGMFKENA